MEESLKIGLSSALKIKSLFVISSCETFADMVG